MYGYENPSSPNHPSINRDGIITLYNAILCTSYLIDVIIYLFYD